MLRLSFTVIFFALLLATASGQTSRSSHASDDSYEYYGRNLTPEESRGRDTWYFWTGGGERMWHQITKVTGGTVDLLLYAESAPRDKRVQTLGTINDPDGHAAEHPDEYGLNLDVCKPLVIPGIPGES